MKLTAGEWKSACESRKSDCVYITAKTPDGDRIIKLAVHIAETGDAKVMAAGKDLYTALKYINHVREGYCICLIHDGMRLDKDHVNVCAEARKAIRKVESKWADPNSPQAQAEWMKECVSNHIELGRE